MDNYGLIYWVEYFDFENELVRFEIHKKGYFGKASEVHGQIQLKYENRKDILQPIVASSLSVNLEANKDLTLQDLYSEEERTFLVKLFKGDQILFIGFIKPDGIWEDLVNEDWEISLDCIDGLAVLKELAFVKDNGASFTGRMPIIEAIYHCLHRIGIDLPINTFLNIDYAEDGSKPMPAESVFERIYINTERYYQDSKQKSEMDCEAVLKSLLNIFSATIFQYKGEWYIIRVPSYSENMKFRRFVGGVFKEEYAGFYYSKLGSEINGFYPHHVNANQRKTIEASVQAYRVKFQYGTVKGMLRNPEISHNGSLSLIDWTIYIDSDVHPNYPTGIVSDTFHSERRVPLISNDTLNHYNDIKLKKKDKVNLLVNFFNREWSVGLRYKIEMPNYVLRFGKWEQKASGNNDHYETVENYKWSLYGIGSNAFAYKEGKGNASFTLAIPEAPEDGNLIINIFRDWYDVKSNIVKDGYFGVTYIDVSPDTNTNVKGEIYTSQRKSRISTVTKEDTTVYNGESLSTIYYSTLTDEKGNPTDEKWRRLDLPIGNVERRGLVSFIPEDTLRMSPQPAMVYEGDVLGYIPFINIVHIEDFNRVTLFTKYSYDTKTCISKVNMREYFSGFLPQEEFRDNVFFEREEDIGNVTKVTIKS
ncbi:hypothetical protein M2T78_19155 [Elizabethkingia ursingii]|uniref:hypothetical protein n=1 Tax=Elizabethkingia ursingii TaxID=1756150 RepID=UPI002011A3A0|nr:hypothetical protein [Elizabethkingia ursingii]MCL1666389.1 hypothetical protein [Elizabethkingia ursingii]